MIISQASKSPQDSALAVLDGSALHLCLGNEESLAFSTKVIMMGALDFTGSWHLGVLQFLLEHSLAPGSTG